MSQITKILVVLLSLFSIFLCGAMVAFVVNTNNYKELYENQQQICKTLQAENATYGRQYDEQMKKTAELEAQLRQEIQALQDQNNQLAADLKNSQRTAQEYLAKSDAWKGVMTGFEQSVRNLQESLRLTQSQLDQARAQGIKDQKELNQITAALHEKIVQLQSLEAERRRLLEQKKDFETKVSGLASGTETLTANIVTPVLGQARSLSPVTYGSDITGVLVDVSQGMATLSVGSADGVQKGMIFHVSRGNQFLCDVVITNVDVNKSAGVLELVQQQPRIGDAASTKL